MRKPMAEDKPQTGFNLQVTYRDEHTGLITHEDPYIRRVVGEERQVLWERPKGSGNLFDKHNNPIGRWISEDKVIKGKAVKVGHHDPDAKHIAFTPPPTADQILAQTITEKDVKIAELEQELKAIQAEREKRGSR